MLDEPNFSPLLRDTCYWLSPWFCTMHTLINVSFSLVNLSFVNLICRAPFAENLFLFPYNLMVPTPDLLGPRCPRTHLGSENDGWPGFQWLFLTRWETNQPQWASGGRRYSPFI